MSVGCMSTCTTLASTGINAMARKFACHPLSPAGATGRSVADPILRELCRMGATHGLTGALALQIDPFDLFGIDARGDLSRAFRRTNAAVAVRGSPTPRRRAPNRCSCLGMPGAGDYDDSRTVKPVEQGRKKETPNACAIIAHPMCDCTRAVLNHSNPWGELAAVLGL